MTVRNPADPETRLGAKMAAMARAEGHRPKLPPDHPAINPADDDGPVARRRHGVADALRDGLSYAEICVAVGATLATVTSDICAVRGDPDRYGPVPPARRRRPRKG